MTVHFHLWEFNVTPESIWVLHCLQLSSLRPVLTRFQERWSNWRAQYFCTEIDLYNLSAEINSFWAFYNKLSQSEQKVKQNCKLKLLQNLHLLLVRQVLFDQDTYLPHSVGKLVQVFNICSSSHFSLWFAPAASYLLAITHTEHNHYHSSTIIQ